MDPEGIPHPEAYTFKRCTLIQYSAGGILLLVVVTGIFTYLCVHGTLQAFCLTTCRVFFTRSVDPEEGGGAAVAPGDEGLQGGGAAAPHSNFPSEQDIRL